MYPRVPERTAHGNIYARSMRMDLSSPQKPSPSAPELVKRLAQEICDHPKPLEYPGQFGGGGGGIFG